MSRYVFLYKLNSKEGNENLLSDLTSKDKFKKTFAEFVADRTLECGISFKTTYEQVIKSVSNDFNQILPSELGEIVRWYEDNVYGNTFGGDKEDWDKKEQAINTLLEKSGIELLFEETGSSASCYAFIFQYGNFTDRYQLDAFDEDNDEGSNIKSYDFISFIEYCILLLCKINESDLSGGYGYSAFSYTEYSANAQHVIDRIKVAYKDDDKLKEIIEYEFEWIKKHWLEHLEDIKTSGNAAKIDPEVQTVYNTYYFLRSSLEMIASIREENKNIVMIHSG